MYSGGGDGDVINGAVDGGEKAGAIAMAIESFYAQWREGGDEV